MACARAAARRLQRSLGQSATRAGTPDFLSRTLKRRRRAPTCQNGDTAMIDHTSLGVRDYDRAIAFYTAILAPLGYALQRRKPDEAAFGTELDWGFFLYPVAPDKSIV